jgi:uncharacterized membrane protein HdeD (DUF308 family)
MNIVQRAKSPIPKFFRVLRSIGLALLAISGIVIAAPVVLPVAVVTVAGYLAVAGGVISAVSQMTVDPSSPVNRTNKGEEENLNKPRDGD